MRNGKLKAQTMGFKLQSFKRPTFEMELANFGRQTSFLKNFILSRLVGLLLF